MRRLTVLLAFAIAISSFCQEKPQEKFAAIITPAKLKDNLTILASDALEGRETGSRGQKMAAAFVRHSFQQADLSAPTNNDFFQRFTLYSTHPGPASIKIGDTVFENYVDVVYNNGWSGSLTCEVVFVGKARSEDISRTDIKGKAVVVWWNAFSYSAAHSIIDKLKQAGVNMILFYPEGTERDFLSFAKAAMAREEQFQLDEPDLNKDEAGLIFINKKIIERLFGDSQKLKSQVTSQRSSYLTRIKPANASFRAKVSIRKIQTENVVGFLGGTDKKEELLIITAHYDHIGAEKTGVDKVNNGADDNGSGTAAVLQLAQAFSLAKKQGHGPRRSILFMTVSAEEWGLYGSEYYTRNPIYPLSTTVANLNIDMIGRRDQQHSASPDYVYVIGSDKLSSELHEINERNNTIFTKLILDYTYNDENHHANLYQRSDHWNFARKNIPVIFYFDGLHEDYHQPSDEVEKIDFDLLAKRTQSVFYTAWEIVNRDARPHIDK